MGYAAPGTNDYLKAGAYIIITIIFIVASVLLLNWWLGMIGFIVWVLLLVPVAIFFLVSWHARNTAYRCPECGHEFTIGTFKDLITPHNMSKFYLKCPDCRKWHWTEVLAKRTGGKK